MESALRPCTTTATAFSARLPLTTIGNKTTSFLAPTTVRWPGAHRKPPIRLHLPFRNMAALIHRVMVWSFGAEPGSEQKDSIPNEEESEEEEEEKPGGEEGLVEELESLEEAAIAGPDEGRTPTDYHRRAHIFDESSRVFRELKNRGPQ